MANKMMFCHKCQKEQEVILSESGPHVKASCIEGHYIKFMSQSELKGEKEMSEFEITIDITGSQYNEVIIVEKYGDKYGIGLGQKSKVGGTVYKKWTYPQVRKDSKNFPAEKAIPLKIVFGSWDDSVIIVKKLAEIFKVGDVSPGKAPAPALPSANDDLPF